MQKLSKAITDICDKDYLWVNHLGKTMSITQLTAAVNAGLICYEKWTSDIQSVRSLDDCAILTSIDNIIIIGGGQKLPIQVYVTAVFFQRSSGLKMISTQWTRRE